MNRNRTCLADGYVFPTEQSITGINANEIVVGPTRSGKTMSVVEPKLLHTYDSSMIVSVTKRSLVEKYTPVFESRGYEVWDLNLADPENGNVAYDPLDFVETDQDIINFGYILVGTAMGKQENGNSDPYWNESAASCLSAIAYLAKLNAEEAGRHLCFNDFYTLYTATTLSSEESSAATSIDFLFDVIDEKYPGNMGSRQWRTLRGNAQRTASCIYSIMNCAVDKLMNESVLRMMKGERRVSFKTLSSKKVILFLTTSPVNKSMQKLSTMFYTDAFRILFEYAESLKSKELPVPVHIIYDDFATGSVVPDFHEYLSIFCAKRMSVTLLLQSESQLAEMYGKMQATTIINNCDTYLYMGGMDDITCQNISRRRNIPVEDVYSMPLEQVMLFRRGSKPVTARRYQTLDDPMYKMVMEI